MSFQYSKVRSAVQTALGRVGKVGEQKSPQTKSNITTLLHDYLVATDGESYFKKRREQAKRAMLDAIDVTKLDEQIAEVKESQMGADVMLYDDGEVLCLTVNIKRPSFLLDTTMLRNALTRTMKPEAVDALFTKCSAYAEPAKTFKVVTRGDVPDDLVS